MVDGLTADVLKYLKHFDLLLDNILQRSYRLRYLTALNLGGKVILGTNEFDVRVSKRVCLLLHDSEPIQ